jgi:hypothetical protein
MYTRLVVVVNGGLILWTRQQNFTKSSVYERYKSAGSTVCGW